MEKIRNLEDIVKQLTNYRDDYSLEADLWDHVELCKKKDGSAFANMNKSFVNARYGCDRWSDMLHPCIYVHGRNNTGYKEFKLDCFAYLDDMARNKDPRYTGQPLVVNSYMRATYLYNDDEIYSKIQARAKACRDAVVRYDTMIETAKKEYSFVAKQAKDLQESIKAVCSPYKDGIYNSSLYYAFRDLAIYLIQY